MLLERCPHVPILSTDDSAIESPELNLELANVCALCSSPIARSEPQTVWRTARPEILSGIVEAAKLPPNWLEAIARCRGIHMASRAPRFVGQERAIVINGNTIKTKILEATDRGAYLAFVHYAAPDDDIGRHIEQLEHSGFAYFYRCQPIL